MGFGGETHAAEAHGVGVPQSLLPECEEALASGWHHRPVTGGEREQESQPWLESAASKPQTLTKPSGGPTRTIGWGTENMAQGDLALDSPMPSCSSVPIV